MKENGSNIKVFEINCVTTVFTRFEVNAYSHGSNKVPRMSFRAQIIKTTEPRSKIVAMLEVFPGDVISFDCQYCTLEWQYVPNKFKSI